MKTKTFTAIIMSTALLTGGASAWASDDRYEREYYENNEYSEYREDKGYRDDDDRRKLMQYREEKRTDMDDIAGKREREEYRNKDMDRDDSSRS